MINFYSCDYNTEENYEHDDIFLFFFTYIQLLIMHNYHYHHYYISLIFSFSWSMVALEPSKLVATSLAISEICRFFVVKGRFIIVVVCLRIISGYSRQNLVNINIPGLLSVILAFRVVDLVEVVLVLLRN